MQRPYPPGEDVLPPWKAAFAPAPDLADWARETFLDEERETYNPDHAHLQNVDIGWLWTTAVHMQQGKRVVGQARMMGPPQQKWSRAMADWQLEQWFGHIPIALIIIDAEYAQTADDASFCALIEHELYHLGQATDEFGMPRFSRDGAPILALRGHDVEEFVGVVARYGARAAGVQEMVEAANRRPLLDVASVAEACGTCMRRAA